MLDRLPIHDRPRTRDMPCPACGYDLRGTPVHDSKRRCPECGNQATGRLRPRSLPWVRRREVGRLHAYLHTLTLAVWLPWRIAAIAESPVQTRSARLFERITLAIGILLGTVLTKIALNTGHLSLMFPRTPVDWFQMPAMAVADTPWGLLPLGAAMWAFLAFSMKAFRVLVYAGSRNRVQRGRLARASRYLSSAVVVSVLLALAAACLEVFNSRIPGYHWSKRWLSGSPFILLAAALIPYLLACLSTVRAAPRARGWRTLSMILFPLPAFFGWIFAWWCCLWLTGYLLIAIMSMLR